MDNVFGRMYQHLVHWMATVKEPQWARECEWRAMFQADDDSAVLVRHRDGSVPFLTFNVRNDWKYDDALPLVEMILGPRCPEETERRVRALLALRGYEHVPVSRSRVEAS